MLGRNQTQAYLDTAIEALRTRNNWRAVLDELPVPAYVADATGLVTYWNQACVDFAGRQPHLGRDKWCVSSELCATTGERLPHEESPMAEAINQRRAVRGKIAIAIRPDGTRRAFLPYPTPFFDSHGELIGAVNLLIDVSDEQAASLSEEAVRCRRLARATNDQQASQILGRMATDYDQNAAALRQA